MLEEPRAVGVLDVVHGAEVEGAHHPRVGHGPGGRAHPAARFGGPMLDALLAEARLRWGWTRPPDCRWWRPTDRGPRGCGARRCWSSQGRCCGVRGRGAGAAGASWPRVARIPGGDRAAASRLSRRGPVRAGDGSTVASLTAADLGTPFYLAPVAPELAAASLRAMPSISWRLRQPDGCPWDREQTHESLREPPARGGLPRSTTRWVLGRPIRPAGELGDLLLQVVLHAQARWRRRACSTCRTSTPRSPRRSSGGTRTCSARRRRGPPRT